MNRFALPFVAILLLLALVPALAQEGYSRDEAEEVASRIFQALLDREPEGAETAYVVAELQRSRPLAAIQLVAGGEEFLKLQRQSSAPAILDRIFEAMLGRKADSSAVQGYLQTIESGNPAMVVSQVLRSDEFARKLEGDLSDSEEDEVAEKKIDLVGRCQKAVRKRTISDRDGKEVPLSFKGYEVKTYPMDDGRVQVRGRALIGSSSASKEIGYECSVDEASGRVFSASYFE